MSYREHNKRLLRRLKPGDIVRFKRGVYYHYYHYAIYIGENKVIHLTAPEGGISSNIRPKHSGSAASVAVDKAIVSEGDFLTVAGDDLAEIANRDEYPSFDVEEILKRAKSMIGHRSYNLFRKNCEHFVNKVKYDKEESTQVQNTIVGLGKVGVGVGLLAAVGIVAYRYSRADRNNRNPTV
ncbi:phospholipase A and acyltransferase 3-like [Physella acuta]|uniref:phospholipase A and acyltransferase 3-like n=1 Tax=Physella acuta TaxID=109671 RepID=UPI0027DD55A0|nr:phospholipase A and acyltransferase 3-like [Physella acuta]